MARNKNLHSAKSQKNDEFYTQLSDIENELSHYTDHFRDKVIYCNCDDPFESNFFKYFAMNFNLFGLKKLICTCYVGSPITGAEFDLFHQDIPVSNQKAYKIEIDRVEDENGDGAIDLKDVELLLKNKEGMSELMGDGDLRSLECVELLKQSDIVVTNPPFSLFREYVAQLMKYEKKFLIIGNQNALTYREIFTHIKNNEMWIGYKFGDMSFMVPDYFEPRATRYWQDKMGQKWRSMGNVCWFTNLDIKKRHEKIDLFKVYKKEEYSKFDYYNAINVDKVVDIPCDYEDCIGVPVTFLDKYSPEQFEIIDAIGRYSMVDGPTPETQGKYLTKVEGKPKYARIIIRRRR